MIWKRERAHKGRRISYRPKNNKKKNTTKDETWKGKTGELSNPAKCLEEKLPLKKQWEGTQVESINWIQPCPMTTS